MTTFKVGDKAIQLQKSKYRAGTIGQVVVIEEVNFPCYEGTHPVVARALDGTGVGMMFRPSDLEKIEELPNVSNLSDHQLAKTFEAAVRELENRAYLSGYNRGKADAEAERVNEVETAEPWIEEFEDWNTPVAVEPIEPIFDGWFDEPTPIAVEPPTEQEVRDAVVRQSQLDVEELLVTPRMDTRNFKGDRESFYPEGAGDCDRVQFVVDREKRTVVALLVYKSSNKAWARGIAKCDPTDVFNEHIGKAIALRRALGLEIPAEYIYAPDPTEIRVGDVVEGTYSGTRNKYRKTISEITSTSYKYAEGGFDYREGKGYTGRSPFSLRVVDDSREEVK
jgi:hypothetical protein